MNETTTFTVRTRTRMPISSTKLSFKLKRFLINKIKKRKAKLTFGCLLTLRNSSSPWANWHLLPYLQVPFSSQDLHNSVLYKPNLRLLIEGPLLFKSSCCCWDCCKLCDCCWNWRFNSNCCWLNCKMFKWCWLSSKKNLSSSLTLNSSNKILGWALAKDGGECKALLKSDNGLKTLLLYFK